MYSVAQPFLAVRLNQPPRRNGRRARGIRVARYRLARPEPGLVPGAFRERPGVSDAAAGGLRGTARNGCAAEPAAEAQREARRGIRVARYGLPGPSLGLSRARFVKGQVSRIPLRAACAAQPGMAVLQNRDEGLAMERRHGVVQDVVGPLAVLLFFARFAIEELRAGERRPVRFARVFDG